MILFLQSHISSEFLGLNKMKMLLGGLYGEVFANDSMQTTVVMPNVEESRFVDWGSKMQAAERDSIDKAISNATIIFREDIGNETVESAYKILEKARQQCFNQPLSEEQYKSHGGSGKAPYGALLRLFAISSQFPLVESAPPPRVLW